MHIYLTLLITLFSSQTLAEIYSWEDKEGVTHFSETKPKNSLGEVTTTLVEHTPSAMIPSLQTTDDNSELSSTEEVTMPDSEENSEQIDPELVDTTEETLTKEKTLPTTDITQQPEKKETEAVDSMQESIEQKTSGAIETTNAIFTSSEEKVQLTTSEIQKELP